MDLQDLLDLEEIRQLRYSFSWALETSTPDDLADLFTEDAWIDVGPWGRMDGQDAIRRGYGKAFGGAPQWGAMHAVTNPRIRIEGDEATGTWYLLDCLTHGNENPLKVLGVYEDTYRRVDDVWRMSSMTLHFKWSEDVGHVSDENPMRILRRTVEQTGSSSGNAAR